MTPTPRQVQVLAAIARHTNGQASLDRIAAALGYRPARSGRLAVRSTLRALLRIGRQESNWYGESGTYVTRLPPQDQWDSELWCLTKASRDLLKNRTRPR